MTISIRSVRSFWIKVDQEPDCWVWMGRRTDDGYGIHHLNSRPVLAHRFSWMLHIGPIPDGICVLHTCDHPWCVNPSHLWLGTVLDNNKDRHSKGRDGSARGDRNGKRTYPDRIARGEMNRNAKLTETSVRFIRDAYSQSRTEKMQALLAKTFGVSDTLIEKVVYRKAWVHVD